MQVGFSGDVGGLTWSNLAYQPYFSATGATPQHGLSSDTMALVTSDCGTMRSLSIKWP